MILWHTHLLIVRLNSPVHWTTVVVLLGSYYFDNILLDRSDDSEDIIVVTEERIKGVEKPHTQVSPAQVCVWIYLHWIKSIFFTVHDNYGQS